MPQCIHKQINFQDSVGLVKRRFRSAHSNIYLVFSIDSILERNWNHPDMVVLLFVHCTYGIEPIFDFSGKSRFSSALDENIEPIWTV